MIVVRTHLFGCLVMLIALLVGCAPISVPTPVSEQASGTGTDTVVITDTPQAEVTATSAPARESTNPLEGAVAILVVDFYDFAVPGDQGDSNNCITTPNGSTTSGGAGQSGSTGVANGLVSSNVYHGELVYQHIKEQFRGAPSHDMSPATHKHGLGVVEVITLADEVYVLAQVNVGNHVTDRVIEQIRGARSWLQEQGVSRFVVNMSVVIKDCDVRSLADDERFAQFLECVIPLRDRWATINRAIPNDGGETANAIVRPQAELAASYYANPFASPEAIEENPELPRTLVACPGDPGNEEALAQLEEVISESFDFYLQLVDDELVQAFMGLTNEFQEENTVYVAAAGNDGYPYPYAPAIFPQVISTGSNVDLPSIQGYWPNRAEWIWDDRFEWEVPPDAGARIFDIDTSTMIDLSTGDDVTMRGTSFATAKMSYLVATALNTDVLEPSCHEEMIYAAKSLPLIWEEWKTATDLHKADIWLDKSVTGLSDSSIMSCPGFPEPSETIPPSVP